MPSRAAVVGGGIAGLAAADAFARHGWEVELFEASDRLGGRIGSRVVDGCLLESGPDGFFAGTESIERLVEGVRLRADVIEPLPGWAGLVRDGRIVPMPAHLWNGVPFLASEIVATRSLSLAAKARLLAEPFVPRGVVEGESLNALLTRRLGSGAADQLVAPLLAGVHAGRAGELEASSVAPGLVAAERGGDSWLATARRSAAGRSGSGRPLRSLAGGMGTLVDGVAANLVSRGAAIHLTVPVSSITRDAERWCLDVAARHFDAILLAVPPPHLAALLTDAAPRVVSAAAATELADAVLVHLRTDEGLPARHRSLHGAIVPAAEPGPVSAITIPSVKWPGRAAARTTTFRVSLRPGADPDVAARVVGRLAGLRRTPDIFAVERQVAAFPVMRVGHAAATKAFRDVIQSAPGLAVVSGAFDGVGLGALISAAEREVERLDEAHSRR